MTSSFQDEVFKENFGLHNGILFLILAIASTAPYCTYQS